jgi:hypothetical protein
MHRQKAYFTRRSGYSLYEHAPNRTLVKQRNTHDHAHQQHPALTHDTLISRTARRHLLKGADAGNERDLTAPSHA